MPSIQVGRTMVAEIMWYIDSTRTKGVKVKIIPQCTTFHETLSSCKFEVCGCYNY